MKITFWFSTGVVTLENVIIPRIGENDYNDYRFQDNEVEVNFE